MAQTTGIRAVDWARKIGQIGKARRIADPKSATQPDADQQRLQKDVRMFQNAQRAIDQKRDRAAAERPRAPEYRDPYKDYIDEYMAGIGQYKAGVEESFAPVWDMFGRQISQVEQRGTEAQDRLRGWYGETESKMPQYKEDVAQQTQQTREQLTGVYDQGQAERTGGRPIQTTPAAAGGPSEAERSAAAQQTAHEVAAETSAQQAQEQAISVGDSTTQHINAVTATIGPERDAALRDAQQRSQEAANAIRARMLERRAEVGSMLAEVDRDVPMEVAQLRLAVDESRRADTSLALDQDRFGLEQWSAAAQAEAAGMGAQADQWETEHAKAAQDFRRSWAGSEADRGSNVEDAWNTANRIAAMDKEGRQQALEEVDEEIRDLVYDALGYSRGAFSPDASKSSWP